MFILQALDLQNYIANMNVETEDGETVRLQDICFQPKTNVCAVESLFQYFQNNKTTLNKCISLLGPGMTAMINHPMTLMHMAIMTMWYFAQGKLEATVGCMHFD